MYTRRLRAITSDGLLCPTGVVERTYFGVSVSPVDDPLVHLIAEAQGVVFHTEVSDGLQLVSGEHLQEEDRTERQRRCPGLLDRSRDAHLPSR